MDLGLKNKKALVADGSQDATVECCGGATKYI
jgi:hypothetical protein